jgi:hypothetical protein
MVNVDLRVNLPMPARYGTLQLSGFYDAGQITMHINPWMNSIQTMTGENSYWLKGAGAELTWLYDNRVSVKCGWAHVIGDNPGLNNQGLNSENMNDSSRVWMLATLFF